MCEPIESSVSFHSSQVCTISYIKALVDLIFALLMLCSCRLIMVI
jgi:hypothetical protein